MNKITVLVVEPLREPYAAEIGNDLTSLQNVVGGYIECIYPFQDNVEIVLNENGKLEGLPPNRGLFDEDGKLYDILCGIFFVVGLGEEDFSSLTPEQIATYTEKYREPEVFIQQGGKITCVKLANRGDDTATEAQDRAEHNNDDRASWIDPPGELPTSSDENKAEKPSLLDKLQQKKEESQQIGQSASSAAKETLIKNKKPALE